MIRSIKNYLSKNTGILIRIDDVAENMNWKLMKKCEVLFDQYNIKPLLGVIPNNKDIELLKYEKIDAFWEKVRGWQKKEWEISMHGLTHIYDQETKKKDYFNYGGRSEFCGHNFETQVSRIKNGLKKFNEENIKIKSFFAPNHTYDKNTFKALSNCGIENVIDGYGLIPYTEKDINFIPQLFYKEIMLPFGIQSTQLHLNYWQEKDFVNFEKFINKNYRKIISFNEAVQRVNNNFFSKSINYITKKSLKFIRIIK